MYPDPYKKGLGNKASILCMLECVNSLHNQQTETLVIESCCACREGMKSKNWRVVRDVVVFKILVQLAPYVVQ